MNEALTYYLEFIHLKLPYKITYTIQRAVKPKGSLMYRLTFPLINGKAKVIVVYKDERGNFSGYPKDIKGTLISALKELKKIEKKGTQVIKINS